MPQSTPAGVGVVMKVVAATVLLAVVASIVASFVRSSRTDAFEAFEAFEVAPLSASGAASADKLTCWLPGSGAELVADGLVQHATSTAEHPKCVLVRGGGGLLAGQCDIVAASRDVPEPLSGSPFVSGVASESVEGVQRCVVSLAPLSLAHAGAGAVADFGGALSVSGAGFRAGIQAVHDLWRAVLKKLQDQIDAVNAETATFMKAGDHVQAAIDCLNATTPAQRVDADGRMQLGSGGCPAGTSLVDKDRLIYTDPTVAGMQTLDLQAGAELSVCKTRLQAQIDKAGASKAKRDACVNVDKPAAVTSAATYETSLGGILLAQLKLAPVTTKQMQTPGCVASKVKYAEAHTFDSATVDAFMHYVRTGRGQGWQWPGETCAMPPIVYELQTPPHPHAAFSSTGAKWVWNTPTADASAPAGCVSFRTTLKRQAGVSPFARIFASSQPNTPIKVYLNDVEVADMAQALGIPLWYLSQFPLWAADVELLQGANGLRIDCSLGTAGPAGIIASCTSVDAARTYCFTNADAWTCAGSCADALSPAAKLADAPSGAKQGEKPVVDVSAGFSLAAAEPVKWISIDAGDATDAPSPCQCAFYKYFNNTGFGSYSAEMIVIVHDSCDIVLNGATVGSVAAGADPKAGSAGKFNVTIADGVNSLVVTTKNTGPAAGLRLVVRDPESGDRLFWSEVPGWTCTRTCTVTPLPPVAILTYFHSDECVPGGNWWTCTHPGVMFFIRNAKFLTDGAAAMTWNASANTRDCDFNQYLPGTAVKPFAMSSQSLVYGDAKAPIPMTCSKTPTAFFGTQFANPIWGLLPQKPVCAADTSLANAAAVRHSPNVDKNHPNKIVLFSDKAATQVIARHPRWVDRAVGMEGDPDYGRLWMVSVPEGQTFFFGAAAGDGWWCYCVGPGTFNIGEMGWAVNYYNAMQTYVSFHANYWSNGDPEPTSADPTPTFDLSSGATETKLPKGTFRCMCISDFVNVTVVQGPREGFASYQVGASTVNVLKGTPYSNPASGLQPPIRFTLSVPGIFHAGSMNWSRSIDRNYGKYRQDWNFNSVQVSNMANKPNAP